MVYQRGRSDGFDSKNNNGLYEVVVDGEIRGSFGHVIDANWYALALLHAGLADSVRLLNGTIVD